MLGIIPTWEMEGADGGMMETKEWILIKNACDELKHMAQNLHDGHEEDDEHSDEHEGFSKLLNDTIIKAKKPFDLE